jgi:hypothetical protein
MTQKLDTHILEPHFEITKEEYIRCLEVLPPARQVSNAFMMGEPFDHTAQGQPRYMTYGEKDGVYYYYGLYTVSAFGAFIHNED